MNIFKSKGLQIISNLVFRCLLFHILVLFTCFGLYVRDLGFSEFYSANIKTERIQAKSPEEDARSETGVEHKYMK